MAGTRLHMAVHGRYQAPYGRTQGVRWPHGRTQGVRWPHGRTQEATWPYPGGYMAVLGGYMAVPGGYMAVYVAMRLYGRIWSHEACI